MSNRPWIRCNVTGEPQNWIAASNWINWLNPRQSLEEYFPGYDVFCLSCCALLAEYDERQLRYHTVFNKRNPLALGSAQIISGNPGAGYVFAAHSEQLMEIGNKRRGRRKEWDNLIQMTVTCDRCAKSHTLHRV